MSDPLFHTDAYLREFEASVVAIGGTDVALDRTAFYPGGGGQPSDQGILAWEGGEGRVAEVRKWDG